MFGRLAYLSSLRNTDTGAYEHQSLAKICGYDHASRILAESHGATFAEWLQMPLERQKRDLENYFESVKSERAQIVDTWIRLTPCTSIIPASATVVERRLFEGDFAIVLELFRVESDVNPVVGME